MYKPQIKLINSIEPMPLHLLYNNGKERLWGLTIVPNILIVEKQSGWFVRFLRGYNKMKDLRLSTAINLDVNELGGQVEAIGLKYFYTPEDLITRMGLSHLVTPENFKDDIESDLINFLEDQKS